METAIIVVCVVIAVLLLAAIVYKAVLLATGRLRMRRTGTCVAWRSCKTER